MTKKPKNTIFSREGQTVTVGDATVTLDQALESTSFLSLLAQASDLEDGDVYGDDGYIYRDGKRARKYFTFRVGWEHFWSPVTKDLRRLEKIVERLEQKSEVAWQRHLKMWQEAWEFPERTMRNGQPSAWFYEQKSNDYLIHYIYEDERDGLTYSMDCVGRERDKELPLNRPEFGLEFARVYRQQRLWSKMLYEVETLLKESIERDLYEKVKVDSYDRMDTHVVEYKLEKVSYLYRLMFIDGSYIRLEFITKKPIRTYCVGSVV